MEKLRATVYWFSGWASAACLIAMTLLILAQIVARLMGVIIPSSEDFAGWLLSATIFFGLAYTFNTGGHIRLTIVLSKLPAGTRKVFEIFALCVGICIVTFIAYYTCYTVYESFDYAEVTDTYLAMPLWLVQFPMGVGSLFLLFACIDSLIVTLSGGTPHYITHEE